MSAEKLRLGGTDWRLGARTGVFGILNVTPDSFSDGGQFTDVHAAVERGRALANEGADAIDVGGESTRPGFQPVSDDDEIARVAPVIEALAALDGFPPISIDTTKLAVARASLEVGARIVNDIWGFQKEPGLAGLSAEKNATCILMHNARAGWSRESVVDSVLSSWERSVSIATDAGVREDAILLDPGIGFTDTREQDLEILRNLKQLRSFGFPILLGVSRKRITGEFLDLPIDERLETTLASSALAAMVGVDFVRVHDVKENRRAVAMIDLIGKV